MLRLIVGVSLSFFKRIKCLMKIQNIEKVSAYQNQLNQLNLTIKHEIKETVSLLSVLRIKLKELKYVLGLSLGITAIETLAGNHVKFKDWHFLTLRYPLSCLHWPDPLCRSTFEGQHCILCALHHLLVKSSSAKVILRPKVITCPMFTWVFGLLTV